MPKVYNKKRQLQKKKKITRPEWYLDVKIFRPYKQFRWTEKERKQLYKMRVIDEMSITSIQRYFRKKYEIPYTSKNDQFTTIRLYNQIRMARAVMENQCHHCRRKLRKKDLKRYEKNKRNGRSDDLKLCIVCYENSEEYKKDRRERALKQGICPACLKRKVIKGRTTCKRCLSLSQRIRYVDNICGSCGKYPINKKRSSSLCTRCLEKNRHYSQGYRDRRKSAKKV